MKLIYLLKEDLKYIASLLLLNIVLAAMSIYPSTSLADSMFGDVTGFYRLDRLGPFLFILYLLVTAILTQRLLAKDSLCDVDAFWLSKPFDGLQMLASKGIILIVVYLVIPWGLSWLVTTNSGVSAPWGALVWHGYRLLWIVPALVFFAVHTKSLSAMLVSAATFAGVLLLGYQFFSEFYFFGGSPMMGGFFHLAAYLIYLVSVSVSIVLPFLSRRISLPRWIAGIGVLVTIVIPLLGLKGYLGPSDRTVENEAIAHSLVVEEPVFILNPTAGNRNILRMEKHSLEMEAVPEKFYYRKERENVSFRVPGKPTVVRGISKGRSLQQTLAESLKDLKEWDLESVYGMRRSSVEIEESFPLFESGNLDDPAGHWYLDLVLARIAIENVVVVPIENGQEIAYGGIRTLLRQNGSRFDYSKYLIIEYSYEDLATKSPIQFRSPKPMERLHRVYFLKGKSGRIWQRKSGLFRFPISPLSRLQKRYGDIGQIEPLTDGVDDEELELVVIDVRDLGKLDLQLDARTSM